MLLRNKIKLQIKMSKGNNKIKSIIIVRNNNNNKFKKIKMTQKNKWIMNNYKKKKIFN